VIDVSRACEVTMRLLKAVASAVVSIALGVAASAQQPPGYVVAATKVWENSIAISPANPNVAAAIGVVGGGGTVQTVYTEDGGRTWHPGGPLGLTTPRLTYERHGDPVIASDRHGTMYVSTMIGWPKNYPLSHSGIAVFRSRDGGKTWEGPFPVVERAPQDKPYYFDDKEWIGVDATGSEHDGNVYVSWLRVDKTNGDRVESVFCRSTDGGVTWSKELVLGSGSGAQMSIGPNGEVYLLRVEGGYNISHVSTDGGVTFSKAVRIARSGTFLSNAIDTSNGPGRGNLYVAWIASFAGPQLSRSFVGTLYYARSTDGGATWGPPVAITPEGAGTALFQTIACDPVTGHLVIAWLDRRADPRSKMFRLYATRSTDGGRTFSPHQAVTEPVDMSHPSPQGFIGDYNQTSAHGGVFLSVFSDGAGQMSVARIAFEDPAPRTRRRPVRP
jgi:hypothetical protein